MNNAWAFLPTRDANDLLDDPGALQAQLDEDGYLLFRDVLPHEDLKAVRRDIVDVLADAGWIVGGDKRNRALSCVPVYKESDEEFQDVYSRVQRLQSFHEMAHHPALVRLMKTVIGDSSFPHPLKVARLAVPGNFETSTPPHQDYPNNQGTPSLMASWIPLSDVTTVLGGLAILRGSHKEGVLSLKGHLGPGNRQAHLPLELLEKCRWVTTDYELGDVLLFPATTVHASLHNTSLGVMRISIDYRWQREHEPLTPGCLEPHGQRLTWEEIYEGWTSDEWQYYWRGLDFEVEEFEKYEVMTDEASNLEMLKLKMQHSRRFEEFVAPATPEA